MSESNNETRSRRTRNYPLRLTDEQRIALELAAERAELSLSEWAREMLLRAAGRPDLAPSAKYAKIK